MDSELKAMSTIQRTLAALSPSERERVLSWVETKRQEGAFNPKPSAPKEVTQPQAVAAN